MAPCTSWTTTEAVQACARYADADEATVDWAVEAATEVLWALSGRQFPGPCEDVVRPSRGCAAGPCGSPRWVDLGAYPVLSVERVTVDGDDLDPSAYVLVDGSHLSRIDGQSFPCCQDVTAAVPRLEVAFTWGQGPPASLTGAVLTLAGELALSRCGSDGCQLDRRVQNVVRQGVQIAMPGLVDAIGNGLTGIPDVDAAIVAANPNRLVQPPSVWLPGGPPVHRVSV